MSACVVEEGGVDSGEECEPSTPQVERPRKEVLLSARGRRACSEQGPHPGLQVRDYGAAHLWGQNSGRKGWSRKRTSAPQMSNPQGSMPRIALVLRSRRSWPVAPQSCRRGDAHVRAGRLRRRFVGSARADGKVVGGGVFRCCVPWCGARAAAPVDDADHALRDGSPTPSHHDYVAPEPVISSPRPLGQQSPLPGIEEEDDSDWPPEGATDALTPSYKSARSSTDTYTSSWSSSKKRSFGSPSSVKICISAAARKSGKARKRGSGEDPPPAPAPARMQAEQGSIGELQKYHGRYLKSRRHTLANVRSESDYKHAKEEAKRRERRSLFSFSESEDDERSSVPPPPQPSVAEAPPTKKPRKRSTKSVPQAAPPTLPSVSSGTLLSSDSEDEKEASRVRRRPDGLLSNITRRVAGGVLKRSAYRSGDTYIELRVYNSKDVQAAANWKERLEQANVAVRYQANYKAPEFEHLKTFLKMVKSNFSEAEGKFYGSSIEKK